MKHAAIAGLLVGSLLLLSACSEPPRPPLRIGVSPWIGGDPLVYANIQQLIDPSVARVVELGSASAGFRALSNGVLEGSVLTLDEALRLADEGVPMRIVGVLDVSAGGDAVVAHPPLSFPSELKHGRIGVEEGAVGSLMLARLLEAGGLSEADVSIRRVEAIDHHEVFTSLQVDAVVTFEPIKSLLQIAGYKVIFDSGAVPGNIVDVLAIRADVMDQRPGDVADVLVGWALGLEAYDNDPEGVSGVMARGAGLSAPDYRAALGGLRFVPLDESLELLSGRPAALEAKAAGLEVFMLEKGLLRKRPDWATLLTPDIVRRALGVTGGAPSQ